MTHHVVDARHLLCPLPVIRTQQAVAKFAVGDTVEVCATDTGALHDIPTWCRIHGHEVLATHQDDTEVRITVRIRRS